MGQSVVDLPDPLENPKLGQTPSADDLLAQLAGDEIDRLLAESDGDKPAAENFPQDRPAAPVLSAETASDLSHTETPTALNTAVDIAAAPAEKRAERAVVQDDDDAFAERAALHPAAGKVASVRIDELALSQTGLPFILRPLEWLSAPLDKCSEQTRELIGKISIVTLLNAVAVLGYVWMFRRHH